ncbi:site-specific integrase [Stutzerimonas stutzeri]
MSSVPSYLLLSRHSIYYFRIVIPDVIRPLFPQREIRRSLLTRCRREALLRSRELLLQVQSLFTDAFRGLRPSIEHLKGSWELQGKRLACWSSWLRQQQLVHHFEHGQEALPLPPAQGHVPAPALTQQKPVVSPSLSSLASSYLAQQEREGVAPKTLQDKRAVVSLLGKIVGDLPVAQITRKEALLFRETALKLPPRLGQIQDLSLNEIVSSASETISVTTFNHYVKNLTTIFSFAIQEGHCEKNPFEGLKVRQRRKTNEERSAFSASDLRLLFNRATYESTSTDKPYRYWLPLLGLYTGARLNELCQLYLDDIVNRDGIDCIHFRQGRADQKLKNVTSERLIPIHGKLVELGFKRFVERQRELGALRLFPEIGCHKMHGYGAVPSKWFARIRQQLGLREGGVRKDFHSFRHTLADHLKQKGVTESLVAGLLGHQAGGITFGRYGKDYRPETLLPVVQAVTLESF